MTQSILKLLIRSIKISLNIITAWIQETYLTSQWLRRRAPNISLWSQLPVNYCKAPTVSKVTEPQGCLEQKWLLLLVSKLICDSETQENRPTKKFRILVPIL